MYDVANTFEQLENHIRNYDLREPLETESVEEAAKVNRLKRFGHLQRINDIRLPKNILELNCSEAEDEADPGVVLSTR